MPRTFLPLQQYKIASGYNVAAGSLVNIETILPTNDVYFYSPKALGFYDPGQEKVRGDGTILYAGFPYLYWEIDAITRAQDAYLKTTYCSGGFSGKVTINTTLGTTTFSRMNAVMILPKNIDSDGQFFATQKYKIKMTRLVAST